MVLGGGAHHRRSADVDLLDQLVDRDAGPAERGRERVEVDHDQLERGDAGRDQLPAVVGNAAIREEAAVDPRVEGLDTAVEHLGAAGHRGDVGHGQTGITERPRGAARRDQLEPAGDEATGEVDEAGLVRDR